MEKEAHTRALRIDHQLARAGWSGSTRVSIEHCLRKGTAIVREGDETEQKAKHGFADYVLLDRMGRPLAIVEAKRSSRDPLEGQRQAAEYADRSRQVAS